MQSQIATFEADGYAASFVLADITTGRTIAYNADAQIYSGAIPDIAVLNGHRRPEQRGPIR